jgi:hypothetical protein
VTARPFFPAEAGQALTAQQVNDDFGVGLGCALAVAAAVAGVLFRGSGFLVHQRSTDLAIGGTDKRSRPRSHSRHAKLRLQSAVAV